MNKDLQDPIDNDLPLDQLHRVDDPDVWGLSDVARGRTPNVPTTIYLSSGDSASGVAGLLMPSGEFLPKAGTDMGKTFIAGTLHDVKPARYEASVEYEVAWDGAKPAEEFINEDGEEAKEHSHGLLLGNYQIRREVERPKGQQSRRRQYQEFGSQTEGTAPQGALVCEFQTPQPKQFLSEGMYHKYKNLAKAA